MSVYCRKKKRTPLYTEKQIEEVPKRPRRFYRTLLKDDYELTMNDEKYLIGLYQLIVDSIHPIQVLHLHERNLSVLSKSLGLDGYV